jgi:putative flippase GtrA
MERSTTAPARPLRSPLRGRTAAALPRQFVRFCCVGLSNTALSYLVYTALVLAGAPYRLAGAVGFAAGAANGYVLNRRWTFASPDSTVARARYLAVQAGGLGATTGLLWLLVSAGGVDSLAAYALAIPGVTVGMFLANRSWTFAHTAVAHRARGDQQRSATM